MLVVCNPVLRVIFSIPTRLVLVPLWFTIAFLVFFYLSKLIFLGFTQLDFILYRRGGRNYWKYCNWAYGETYREDHIFSWL